MKIIAKQGDPDLATVYVARFRGDPNLLAEFVDARDPALPLKDKWVIIVSTQFGCAVGCLMCDSGGDFKGNLTADEILAQIDAVLATKPRTTALECKKLKIQFARMGEPALNPAVLDVLGLMASRYDLPGLMPCITTTAPRSARGWFDRLLEIKRSSYSGRHFQLQFSINSTDETTRDRLMPVPKMSFDEIEAFGRKFVKQGDRKAGLNFALTSGVPVDPDIIARHFDPEHFVVKLTPLNPTDRASSSGLETALPVDVPGAADRLVDALSKRGFDVIVSIGEPRENEIGSNCGMTVRHLKADYLGKSLRTASLSRKEERIATYSE